MNKNLKAVLFDMGSTLLEFENSTWEVLGKACTENSYRFLSQKNLDVPELGRYSELLGDEFLKARALVEGTFNEFRFEKVASDFFNTLDLNTNDGYFDTFVETYYQPITDQITLIDGAVDILQKFKEHDLLIGIVSNTIFPQRFHLRELKRFGLYPYLKVYLFSSEVGVRKPHPRIFLEALQELRVDPSQAIFIGDRLLEDVGGAQKAGMKGILKCHEGRDYTAPIIPDAQISDLNELPKTVLNLF